MCDVKAEGMFSGLMEQHTLGREKRKGNIRGKWWIGNSLGKLYNKTPLFMCSFNKWIKKLNEFGSSDKLHKYSQGYVKC